MFGRQQGPESSYFLVPKEVFFRGGGCKSGEKVYIKQLTFCFYNLVLMSGGNKKNN